MALDDLFFISMAAEHAGHASADAAQVRAARTDSADATIGSMRLYAREELERLRLIKQLVDDWNQPGRRAASAAMAEVMQRIRPLMDEPR